MFVPKPFSPHAELAEHLLKVLDPGQPLAKAPPPHAVRRSAWPGEAAAFNRLDRSADGHLAPAELEAALGRLHPEALRTIQAEVGAARGVPWWAQPTPLGMVAAVGSTGLGFAILFQYFVQPPGGLANDPLTWAYAAGIAGLVGAWGRSSWGTAARRRRIARLLGEGGADKRVGAGLATAIVMVLDQPATLPFLHRQAETFARRPRGDGWLDAREWGGPGMPGNPVELAAALDALDPRSQEAATAAVDRAIATSGRVHAVDLLATTVGTMTILAVLLALHATGGRDKRGHYREPNPELVATSMTWAGGFVLAGLAINLAARAYAAFNRRRLGRELRAIL